jgi:hypothetical protein
MPAFRHITGYVLQVEETLPSGRLKDSRRTLPKTKAGQATNVDHRDGSSGVGAQGRNIPDGEKRS